MPGSHFPGSPTRLPDINGISPFPESPGRSPISPGRRGGSPVSPNRRDQSPYSPKKRQIGARKKTIQPESSSKSELTYHSVNTLKVAPSHLFDGQLDRQEALEHNGASLPDEYLLAKLSFTRDEHDVYRKYLKGREAKDQARRTTGHHFFQADIFNETNNSFNEMLMSEKDEGGPVAAGLDQILDDFKMKTEFLKAIKSKSKVATRQETEV